MRDATTGSAMRGSGFLRRGLPSIVAGAVVLVAVVTWLSGDRGCRDTSVPSPSAGMSGGASASSVSVGMRADASSVAAPLRPAVEVRGPASSTATITPAFTGPAHDTVEESMTGADLVALVCVGRDRSRTVQGVATHVYRVEVVEVFHGAEEVGAVIRTGHLDGSYPRPARGSLEYVVLHRGENSPYHYYAASLGRFLVEGDEVAPLGSWGAVHRYQSMARADFEAELREALASLRRRGAV